MKVTWKSFEITWKLLKIKWKLLGITLKSNEIEWKLLDFTKNYLKLHEKYYNCIPSPEDEESDRHIEARDLQDTRA